MLDGSNLMAFLATTDSARTRAFYEGVLELHLIADDPFAVVYESVIQNSWRMRPASGYRPPAPGSLG